VSIASAGLRDGTEFGHYVMRMRRTAAIAVVNDLGQVLLLRRHRFIINRWGREMPGGYAGQAEDPAAAAREAGKRRAGGCLPRQELALTFQPMIGNAGSPRISMLHA